MLRKLFAAACFALLCVAGSSPAYAQRATVVSTCASLSPAYVVGSTVNLTILPDGSLCTNAVAGGGTSNVNVLQFGSSAVATGTGAAGAGVPRFTVSDDAKVTLGQTTKSASVPVTIASDQGSTPVNLNATPTIANGNGHVIAPSSEALAAIAPVVSAALESNHVIKASAGNFYSGYVTTGATAGWLLLANSTTAPTAGGAAIAPIACVVAPANATTAIGGLIPLRASTGITLVFSSSGCLTNTASATAYFSGLAN